MNKIITLIKNHFEFVLIGIGLIVAIGAIRNWKWVTESTTGQRARHAFIFAMWGEKGYRVLMFICGILLVGSGLAFLWYK